MDTKEKILQVSLKLFARDGYEGVSVRNIAEELGITKGALYKHYENKHDIFDSIIQRMEKMDAQKAKEFDVPVGTFEDAEYDYRNVAFGDIKAFSIKMFKYWTEDEFASNFRKMLTLEQYRNPKMASLLNQYLTGGVIGYAKDLIGESVLNTKNSDKDPEILALEYFAPIYMMMGISDSMENKGAAKEMVEKHIDYFMGNLR
ncbi:TetR/AcrR family transcriptional regulator [Paenibacillus sp. 79R4]|uniref:TetR/AcrR family transcriptional regulator n=1 Tax=Paenibacillus sp. 79R4 TaxID=2212847 RepID=UPI0015BF6984|nr:TetR/AcrR family transcriptional regulator [Paenibacillus sp. 79R4]NWL87285.1 TetR/AcrR family transcriptional regulator [Paenibacillus sp. 79R4]